MGSVRLTEAMAGLGSPTTLLLLAAALSLFTKPVFSSRIEEMLTDYHNYTELVSELESMVESYPNLARIYSLGKSTQNRELMVLQISEGVTFFRKSCRPFLLLLHPKNKKA